MNAGTSDRFEGLLSPQAVDAEADHWISQLSALPPGEWLVIDRPSLSGASCVGLAMLIDLGVAEEQTDCNAVRLTA
jgi:hypothetical protein